MSVTDETLNLPISGCAHPEGKVNITFQDVLGFKLPRMCVTGEYKDGKPMRSMGLFSEYSGKEMTAIGCGESGPYGCIYHKVAPY